MSAITAAAITYAVTRACTSGDLVECSCDKNHFHRYNVAQQQTESIDNRYNIDVDINIAKRRQRHRHQIHHHRHGLRQPSNRGKHKTRRRHNNANVYLRKRNVYRNVIAPDGDWQWGGCGDNDNVMFGFRKSKDFLNARYHRLNDIRTLVKLHNNNAGALVKQQQHTETISIFQFRFSFSFLPFFEFILNQFFFFISHLIFTLYLFFILFQRP